MSSSGRRREETKETVSSRGESWDRLYVDGRTPWETHKAASQLIALVRSGTLDVAGKRCVELCCGTGASSVYLAAQGASRVVGVDVSRVAVESARRRAEEAGVSQVCDFVVGDLLDEETVARYGQFDVAFECQGFQLLWAVDADKAAFAAASLVAPGGVLVTVAGNANEYRAYDGGGASLTVAELVGSLSPPAFALESLVETRFDAGECGQDSDAANGLPPLAWRAVFSRLAATDAAPTRKEEPPPAATQVAFSEQPKQRLPRTRTARDSPPVIARKLTYDQPSPTASTKGSAALDSESMDDAVDAALSVDGSVAPSDCGSDATSAFAGADGFENIAASRAAAARAERARAEGDVPWVRWWDRRANAYDALCESQPVLARLARRVAKAALHWAYNLDSRKLLDLDDDAPLEPDAGVVACVDLAAGSGLCAWAVADCASRAGAAARCDLVEPSHAMAALARARAASLCRRAGLNATVWQIPAERCHDRLPPRLHASVDVVTCSAALDCLNYHDVFEVAAALLRPGGALAFDLAAEAYDGTADDDLTSSWLDDVKKALDDRGLLDLLAAQDKNESLDALVARVRSRPPARPPVSATSVAAAAAAAGLRLAECRLATDAVAGDFFVAFRAMSTSWLAEPFSGMSSPDAKHLRAVVLLDAAARAAKRQAKLRTAVFVLVKPLDPVLHQTQDDPPTSRPITQAINDDHFAPAGPAKV